MLTARLLLRLADAEPATELSRDYRKLLLQVQHEHELTIAAQIQRALLPQSRYGGLGFEIAAMSVPCRAIGGDFPISSMYRAGHLPLSWAMSRERDHQRRFSRLCFRARSEWRLVAARRFPQRPR